MFGKKIKQVRAENGLNQAEFAQIIGISPGALSSYELNNSIPSAETIRKICQEFEVSADWLLSVGSNETFSLENYSGAISALHSLSDTFGECSIACFSKSQGPNGIVFTIADSVVFRYFTDYEHLMELRNRGDIGGRVVDTWQTGQLQEYDFLIESDATGEAKELYSLIEEAINKFSSSETKDNADL